MLDAFIWLLLLCVAMLVASFVAGCIPLATKLSEEKLNFLTAVSVGLLVSTSLVVIIPEGVETLYNKNNEQLELQSSSHQLEQTEERDHALMADHTAVGLALLIGFAVMFVIDQVSSLHVHPSSSSLDPNNTTVNRNSLELDAILTTSKNYTNNPASTANNNEDSTTQPKHTSDKEEVSSDNSIPHFYKAHSHSSVSTPTIGLIVHAAADGIALGASASQPQLSMVVFFAIMLHKAPSAFALTAVLLSEGLSRTCVRQHLLMFSVSAPAGAISTYALLQLFSAEEPSSAALNLEYWTGLLLLFSGGTFLYVAMHAIQELPKASADHKLGWKQLGSILTGMLIPFILNFNHSH